MVKRYRPGEKKRGSIQIRGLLLYLLPLPLLPAFLFALLDNNLKLAVGCGLGFVLAIAAATLVRKGLRIESQASKRKIARRTSTVDYKMLGAVVLGIATASTSIIAIGNGLLVSLLMGLATLLGIYLYYGFGLDRQKPELAAIGITAEEVIALLDEAEAKIRNIETARQEIKNQELRDRLKRIVKQTRSVLTIIEEDPRDARRARKFLKVYLDGAQQVIHGYAQSHQMLDSEKLDEKFRRVLDTIETVIVEQQQKLLENNASELDVQIEVLQMQLEKEGVA